jgi:hypothetical protein
MDVFRSLKPYVTLSPAVEADYTKYLSNLKLSVGGGKQAIQQNKNATFIYTRNPEIKGPMTVFGYDYFTDHYKAKKQLPALLNFSGLNRSGAEYAYEALNFVNGKNTVLEIRNRLSAEFGPIPLDLVAEFLEALETIAVIKRGE